MKKILIFLLALGLCAPFALATVGCDKKITTNVNKQEQTENPDQGDDENQTENLNQGDDENQTENPDQGGNEGGNDSIDESSVLDGFWTCVGVKDENGWMVGTDGNRLLPESNDYTPSMSDIYIEFRSNQEIEGCELPYIDKYDDELYYGIYVSNDEFSFEEDTSNPDKQTIRIHFLGNEWSAEGSFDDYEIEYKNNQLSFVIRNYTFVFEKQI